jgi:hypothetical protein
MGDMRASIRLVFRIHGKVYKQDLWINYSPDSDGVDERIKEFFRESWDDSLHVYDAIIAAYEAEERERREREELARLTAKYAN